MAHIVHEEEVKSLLARADVQAALQNAADEVERAMKEQIEISEIPSPTFEEEVRAQDIARRMREYGLTDVVIDPSGNVVGRRPGKKNGPVVAIAAHTDTVFARDVDVKVRQEGNLYYGPGIGDNASGLRSMLQILRSLNAANIETDGDILFVGTVGEEGNGDIRGAKALFDGSRKIDAFVALDMANIFSVQNGACGAHRWRMSIDGQGGHSFLDYGEVPSAIHAMCRAGNILADLRIPESPKTTYTIGTIKGGTTVNTIAAHCEVDIDLRSFDMPTLMALEEKVLAAFDRAVREENKHWPKADEAHQLKLTKTQIGDRPAGMRPDDCPAVGAALGALAALGLPCKRLSPSSTDCNKPMSMNIPSVCIGTGGETFAEHSVKEYFDSTDMHLGPQVGILVTLALAGMEGNPSLIK